MRTNVNAVSVSSVPMDTLVKLDTARISAQRRLVVHVPFAMQENVFAPWAMSEIRMISTRGAAYEGSVAMMPTADTRKSVSNWARVYASASMPAPRFSVDPMRFALPTIIARRASARMVTLVIRAIYKWVASRNVTYQIWKINARRTKIANEDLAVRLEDWVHGSASISALMLSAVLTSSAKSTQPDMRFATVPIALSGTPLPPPARNPHSPTAPAMITVPMPPLVVLTSWAYLSAWLSATLSPVPPTLYVWQDIIKDAATVLMVLWAIPMIAMVVSQSVNINAAAMPSAPSRRPALRMNLRSR